MSDAALLLSADAPRTLHDLGGQWRVTAGYVDVFAVQLRQGRPAGRRHFLLRLALGMPVFGLGQPVAEGGWTLLAVGGLDTEARPVPPGKPEADAIEAWIAACDEVFRDPELSWGDVHLALPGILAMKAGNTLAAHGQQVLWASVQEGVLRGSAGQQAEPGTPPLPVSASAPLLVVMDSRLRLEPTLSLLGAAGLDAALAAWHQALLVRTADLVARRLAALSSQLSQSTAATRRTLTSGLAHLAGFAGLEPDLHHVGEDADLRAVARVADAIGQAPLTLARALSTLPPGPPRMDALIDEAGLRARRVLLRQDWWRGNHGPLVGLRQADATAVALLPLGRGRYRAWDPRSNTSRLVDAAIAAEFSTTAWMLYRTLPEVTPGPYKLMRFALAGGGPLPRHLILASLVGSLLGLGVPLATGVLVESVIPSSATGQIAVLGLGLVAAALGAAAVNVVRALLLLRLESRIDLNTQPALFDRLLRLNASFFKRFTAGDLADRAMAVQEMRRMLTGTTLTALFAGILSMVNLGVMLFCSRELALAGLGIVLLQTLIGGILAVVQLHRERQLANRRGQAEGFVLQTISGAAKLKVAAATDRAFALWARLFGAQRDAFLAVRRAAVMQSVVLAALLPAGMALLFVVGAGLALRLPLPLAPVDPLSPPPEPLDLGLGAWVAFSAAFGQLTAGLSSVVQAVTQTLGLMPLYERARPLLDATPESGHQRQPPGTLSGAIEFNSVTFSYAKDAPPALNQLSFSIRPGEFVAIVGPSGSGKSTVLRLLLGFEEPQEGEILYDSRSLATLDTVALRRQIGVVLQNGRVQPGSIIENIGGGRPISLEEAWHAVRLAGLEADVKAMPMGMHTVLTDGGTSFSGGQRQRLMIARALARRPRVLLLDEATSALDNRTQSIVTEAVTSLALTRVIIAHRLSTIERVDRVLVLDRGRLVQEGSFTDLSRTPGLFQDLARRQMA
jgi:NHLM bacteriocin system ABC transporter ATP-binding protein